MTEFDRALSLLAECQMPGEDPDGSETYPAREDGVDSIANGLAAAQVLASLAIAGELRRLNDGRDRFNEAMLEFFEKLANPPTEGPSGAGATAQVVEKEGP